MGRSFLRSMGFTTLFLYSATQSLYAQERFPVELIYGLDNRAEIDQYNDTQFIDMAQSVALRVSRRRLMPDRTNPKKILFPLITLEKTMPQLCNDERFIEQISLGTCSGFLVAPNKLVTAGHCMLNENECESYRWVFGFKNHSTDFNLDQVYSCKKILHQKYVYNEREISDYAVVELDRNVVGHTPLKLRKFGRVSLGSPVVVIGHPLGLPMKATDGAVVSRMNAHERQTKIKSWLLRSHYFTANLDAYGGNSGSPVFNVKTKKVEGILIQGADDFVYNPQKECMVSRRLNDDHLETYEKVMRINKVPGLN